MKRDEMMDKKKLWIGGKWIETENHSILVNPYNQNVLAYIADATKEHTEMAITEAKKAFKITSEMPAHQRSEILYKVSRLMEENLEECARIIAMEAAKPIKTARGEIARTIQTYRFAAEEAKRINGESLSLDAAKGGENRIGYTQRRPIGVIAAITPFNFPFNLVAHKVGPAIAAGNTVVLKPSDKTPLSALRLAQFFEEAGLPAGALNVVTGKGRIIGNYMVQHDDVKMVTFTGSPPVGKMIRQNAGMKRVTLELGSNSAVIIDREIDPTQLDSIAERCVESAFAYAGQVCISLQRIYVHEDVFPDFIDKFVEQSKKLKLGDPLSEETDLSALISLSEGDRISNWIDEAVSKGAEIALDGRNKNGTLHPTVLVHVDHKAKISCEEAFAPVAIVNTFKSINEAIDLVNDSSFGLQAGIYSNNINHAFLAADKLEVGGVMINDTPTFRVDHMPYGGLKNSGTGREGIHYATEEMTEMKLVTIKKLV